MDNYIKCVQNYNMYQCLEKAATQGREVVFLCVGNSKVWYDSFGPLLGGVLQCLNLNKFIYGNHKYNITAKNLGEFVNLIYRFHNNPFIIVIDSCLSRSTGLKVSLSPCEVAAFSDEKRVIGDLSINYLINKEEIKSPSNFSKMLREIKNVARFINFVFN